DFDDVLADAQQKGFAEADPTADIEGLDPCRKIAILTSLISGHQVDFTDIPCEGITKITPEDFAYAKKMGRSIKLLAMSKKVGGSYSCMVAPYMISADHPLSMVNGVFNAVFVKGNMLGDAMFYGSGAGKLPTASAVVADVVDMIKHKHVNIIINWEPEKIELVGAGQSVNRFFVRTQAGRDAIASEFGDVEYVDAGISGEIAFTTGEMTEAEFAEKAARLGMIGRIRLD
ncbi:MAG: homoserine dehydrogenase, partial [Clostridiales bacterium]|nr:homoserine dehydrogenase [Clostridiales bacterium]